MSQRQDDVVGSVADQSPDRSLAALGIVCVRAANPGPLTLSGTNSWVLGRDPAWIVDPGPALDGHLDALAAEAEARGGVGGIAVTHGHADHADGISGLVDRLGGEVSVGACALGGMALSDGDRFGPLQALALPGHAGDHLGFLLETRAGLACFTGDAVLGEGSVFIAGDMGAYIAALRRLKSLAPSALCPGHGPPVWEVAGHLDAYLSHRLEREQRLVAALERGLREEPALLRAVWGDVPAALGAAAAATLRSHLQKLQAEGRHPVPR